MAWPLSSPTLAEVHARVARRRRVKLTLNEDEVRALYALAQHDAQGSFGCPLQHTPDGIAGTHEEHGFAVSTALAKLADAVLAVQENNTKEQ